MNVAIFDPKNCFGRIMQNQRCGLSRLYLRLVLKKHKTIVFSTQPVTFPGVKDRPLHRFTQDLRQFNTLISINSMEPFFLYDRSRRLNFYCLYPEDPGCMAVFASFKYKYYVDGFLFSSGKEEQKWRKQFGLTKDKSLTASQFIQKFLRTKKSPYVTLGKKTITIKQGIQAFRSKDYQRAVTLLKSQGRSDARLICAFSQLKLQNWIQSAELFNSCIIKKQCLADALFGLALVQLITGNLKKGLRYLIRARKIQPSHAEVTMTINIISERLGLEPESAPAPVSRSNELGIADPEYLFTVM